MAKSYSVDKNIRNNLAKIDSQSVSGFKFKPKNKVKYSGIKVDEMVFINNSFVEHILKRKIKKRLNLYLDYIINLSDDEAGDNSQLEIAINNLARYKSVIKRKYSQYLDRHYIELLLKKINLIEYELKMKYYNYEKTEEKGKSR